MNRVLAVLGSVEPTANARRAYPGCVRVMRIQNPIGQAEANCNEPRETATNGNVLKGFDAARTA
jgi:hypothetical protein